MNNYHKAKVGWLNQSISTYKLDIKSLINTAEYVDETQLIEPLLKILKIPYIHQWQLKDWQGLLKFTDLSALINIQPWLKDVAIDTNMQVCLYFKSAPEEFHDLIRFYIKQLEIFLRKNTRSDLLLTEVFQ